MLGDDRKLNLQTSVSDGSDSGESRAEENGKLCEVASDSTNSLLSDVEPFKPAGEVNDASNSSRTNLLNVNRQFESASELPQLSRSLEPITPAPLKPVSIVLILVTKKH